MDYKRDEVMRSFYATEQFLCDKDSTIYNSLIKQMNIYGGMREKELNQIINTNINDMVEFEKTIPTTHKITRMKKERAQELLNIRKERERLSEERFIYYVKTYKHPEIERCQKKIEDHRKQIRDIEGRIKEEEKNILKFEEEEKIIKGTEKFKLVEDKWGSDLTPVLLTDQEVV